MTGRQPYRWDLVRPDQLGRLLDGCAEPSLWFVDELVACAGKVLARGGDARLLFVGRSADSVVDLLSGALAGSPLAGRLQRLPFSFRADASTLSRYEVGQARAILAAAGLAPGTLTRPVRLVDLVHEGHTFTNLYQLLRDWADEEHRPWKMIRRQLGFVGITSRTRTSPGTWRWHQHADWARELPASAFVNVSLDPEVWSYFGNYQPKLTGSFHRQRWLQPDGGGPRHDRMTREALAEAVALVEYGRRPATRRAIARVLNDEPRAAPVWLSALTGPS